jgi:hypothetical protein
MMHQVYTLPQIAELFLGFCAALITVSTAIGIIYKWVNKAKEPTNELRNEVGDVKKRVDQHDDAIMGINKMLAKDKRSIDEIKEGNRVTQRSVLAILEVLTDDDVDKDRINKTKSDLNDYLVSK